jgi:hypothetical protein
MSPVIFSTLAALIGSAVGATAPILSNYVLQRGLTRRELLNHQIAGKEALYSDFIQEAARVHVHSLSHDLEDVGGLVGLHALVSRIRLLSSDAVVDAADQFLRQAVRNYGKPNISFAEMRDAALASEIDPLTEFSVACRAELKGIFK